MHIAEKYITLARDSMSSGDIVAAENYLQHAEHYNRIIMAAQTQNGGGAPMEGGNGANGGRFAYPDSFQGDFDGDDDDGDGDGDGDDFAPPARPQFQERTHQDRQNGRSYDRGQNGRPQHDRQGERQNDRQGDRQNERYNGDRPRQDRPDYDRSQSYNQHQQPQPYVSPPAFSQNQPQPQPLPVPPANGDASKLPESPEAERAPRRRRRRPIDSDAAPPVRATNAVRDSAPAAMAVNGTGGDVSSDDPAS